MNPKIKELKRNANILFAAFNVVHDGFDSEGMNAEVMARVTKIQDILIETSTILDTAAEIASALNGNAQNINSD